ncbi:class I SAM-dependent methyltransferase [Dermatophilaceae bacterium Soc4.6]
MTPTPDEAIPSPNIWGAPLLYEVENLGVDRAGVIESAMRAIADWRGRDVLDVGCGTGFHLPRFAADARSVVGVEPHPPLVERARARAAGMPSVRVLQAGAAATGLSDASVDVAHARWAYFFGPGCEPGLAELERVVRPGGTAFVIDNDASRSTFGRWFRRSLPSYDPAGVDRFWRRQGWQVERLDIEWTFDTRVDFEQVVRLELAPEQAQMVLEEDRQRTGADYAVALRWRRY